VKIKRVIDMKHGYRSPDEKKGKGAIPATMLRVSTEAGGGTSRSEKRGRTLSSSCYVRKVWETACSKKGKLDIKTPRVGETGIIMSFASPCKI